MFGQIEHRLIDVRPALHDRISPPTLSQLAQREETFVAKRSALHLTRTVEGDLTAAMEEIKEAAAEVWPSGKQPRRRQKRAYTFELADVVIYTSSALSAHGTSPEKIHKTIQTQAHQDDGGSLLDRLRTPHPEEHVWRLQRNAHFAHEIIINGQNPLDTPEEHSQMRETALLGVLGAAYEAGKAMCPKFERLVAKKIRSNERRFREEDFTVKEGQDPTTVRDIGYARTKRRVKQWTHSRAVQYLETRGISAAML